MSVCTFWPILRSWASLSLCDLIVLNAFDSCSLVRVTLLRLQMDISVSVRINAAVKRLPAIVCRVKALNVANASSL